MQDIQIVCSICHRDCDILNIEINGDVLVQCPHCHKPTDRALLIESEDILSAVREGLQYILIRARVGNGDPDAVICPECMATMYRMGRIYRCECGHNEWAG